VSIRVVNGLARALGARPRYSRISARSALGYRNGSPSIAARQGSTRSRSTAPLSTYQDAPARFKSGLEARHTSEREALGADGMEGPALRCGQLYTVLRRAACGD
jgi:hypothetical protein